MRTLMELVADLDRNNDTGFREPPPRPPHPRGEGDGPRGGMFWLHGAQCLRIATKVNEIVFPSGQAVLLNPETYGLTPAAIMQELRPHGSGQYSPASAYQQYLDGTDYDLSHVSLLWKASKIVYAMMLRKGWASVIFHPPESIHLAMIPGVVKQQMAAAAEHFPLMQIDHIAVTEITNFDDLSDRHPTLTKNKSLLFRKEDFKGFAGPFGAVMDWTGGGEAPASNYLYFRTQLPIRPLSATIKNVATDKGYRRRWGITFFAVPPKATDELVARVPLMTVFNGMAFQKHWNRGVSQGRNGTATLYSDRPFGVAPRDVEVQQDGVWRKV